MKHWIFAPAAALLAVALATPGTALADPRGHGHGHGHHREWREHGHHDSGLHRGWDRHHYNGYSYGGVWYYGPPPVSLGEVVYGYRVWRRGDYLPGYYRHSLAVVDYHAYDLAPPPIGYHYVVDDHGDYLLVGIATGVILGVILAHHH